MYPVVAQGARTPSASAEKYPAQAVFHRPERRELCRHPCCRCCSSPRLAGEVWRRFLSGLLLLLYNCICTCFLAAPAVMRPARHRY
mmetsp:Transcript_5178/g.12233  ORF Transcript_5178/g.12233 Transcript_5178/m.12233 type:complete len:86 (-) Transcript_5178:233-490(-)